MNSRALEIGSLLVVASLLATPGHAQNMGFLAHSPIAYFTAEDLAMMRAAGKEALDTLDRGKSKTWSNPATGTSGRISVTKTYTAADGSPCKRVAVSNRAKGIEGESRYTLCRSTDGTWSIDTSPPQAK